VKLTRHGKEVLRTSMDTAIAPQMHKIGAFSRPRSAPIANSAQVLGYGAGEQIEGFSIPGKLLTFQGHPELTPRVLTGLIKNANQKGMLDGGIKERSLKSIDSAQSVGTIDQIKLMEAAIVRFLAGPGAPGESLT
jgi:hypothetical protein